MRLNNPAELIGNDRLRQPSPDIASHPIPLITTEDFG
jgi:hypothetical protein